MEASSSRVREWRLAVVEYLWRLVVVEYLWRLVVLENLADSTVHDNYMAQIVE